MSWPGPVQPVLVVEAAHRQDRGGRGRGKDRVPRREAEVSRGRDDEDPGAGRLLGGLREAVEEVRRLVVPSAGDVADPDSVALPVPHDPLEAAADVLVGDPPRGAHLHEDDVHLGGEAPVEAARERAVPARDDGGHHPVPARLVGPEDARVGGAGVGDVDVPEDAVARLHEVGVGVEARIEEGDRDAPPAEAVVRTEPERRREDRAGGGLLGHGPSTLAADGRLRQSPVVEFLPRVRLPTFRPERLRGRE